MRMVKCLCGLYREVVKSLQDQNSTVRVLDKWLQQTLLEQGVGVSDLKRSTAI